MIEFTRLSGHVIHSAPVKREDVTISRSGQDPNWLAEPSQESHG